MERAVIVGASPDALFFRGQAHLPIRVRDGRESGFVKCTDADKRRILRKGPH
ncbi:MAG: hypothetical protein ACLT98_12815 [Eggerthellaceae bacterium]